MAKEELKSSGQGTTFSELSADFLASFQVPFPPDAEQLAIVRFLDHANRRFQRYIRAKEELIELLEEQTQAIIHEVVTGQMDVRTGRPYPAYKSSGIEWLGHVPAHWEVRKLGRFGRLLKGNGGSKEDETSEGIPCIRYGDLYTTHAYSISSSRSRIAVSMAIGYTSIMFGDVLFAASGETIEEIGKSAVNLIQGEACCGGDIILFRPYREFNARYLGYVMDCRVAANQKATMGRGITVMHIYGTQLKYLTLPFAPFSEQAVLTRFLDDTITKTEHDIARARNEIDLIHEYRTRLISDVVTGKLDVREAAAALSEELGDPDAVEADFTGVEEGGGDRRDRDRRTAVPATQEEATP